MGQSWLDCYGFGTFDLPRSFAANFYAPKGCSLTVLIQTRPVRFAARPPKFLEFTSLNFACVSGGK